MPTAQKFHSLGQGNGFPFCLTRVDVDDYDYWVTLGGTKKGDSLSGPTFEAQKFLSRNNAMKLYWNGFQFPVDIFADSWVTGDTAFVSTSAATFHSGDTPSKRVCDSARARSDGSGSETNGNASAVYSYRINTRRFVRFYLAGKFIGLGMSVIANVSTTNSFLNGTFGFQAVTRNGFINATFALGGCQDTITPPNEEFQFEQGYLSVGNIPFTYYFRSIVDNPSHPDNTFSITMDKQNLNIQIDGKSEDTSTGEVFIDDSVKIQLLGLDFYTYP